MIFKNSIWYRDLIFNGGLHCKTVIHLGSVFTKIIYNNQSDFMTYFGLFRYSVQYKHVLRTEHEFLLEKQQT